MRSRPASPTRRSSRRPGSPAGGRAAGVAAGAAPRATRPLTRLVLGVVLIAAIVGGDSLYGRVTGPSKISNELSGTGERVHVIVHLPFEPERYHLEALAEYGSFAGTGDGDRQVRLVRVTPGNLTALSRLLWVSSIEAFEISP